MYYIYSVILWKFSTLFDYLHSICSTLCLPADIPADDILELFGKTFFEFCQDSGYDKILQVLGATPRDFLQVSKKANSNNFYQLSYYSSFACCFSFFGSVHIVAGH